jgi:hypothetical protein
MLIVVVIFLVLFIWAQFRLLRLAKNYRALSDGIGAARRLGSNKIGETIYVPGRIVYPNNEKTPIGRIPCSYYKCDVRAEFVAKRKKPAKGKETYKPLIYTESADEKPLIVSNNTHTAHILSDSASNVAIDLNKNEKSFPTPPNQKIQALSKPKYKKFNVTEYWLPRNAQVVVIGTVADINGNCVTLTRHPQGDAPFLISTDSFKSLFQRVSKASRLSRQRFWILTLLTPVLSWLFYYHQKLAAVAVTLVIGSLISELFRRRAKTFPKKAKKS